MWFIYDILRVEYLLATTHQEWKSVILSTDPIGVESCNRGCAPLETETRKSAGGFKNLYYFTFEREEKGMCGRIDAALVTGHFRIWRLMCDSHSRVKPRLLWVNLLRQCIFGASNSKKLMRITSRTTLSRVLAGINEEDC